jgi:hypothetical protein
MTKTSIYELFLTILAVTSFLGASFGHKQEDIPECYTDLDQLFEDEGNADVSVPRTRILCPNTNFKMGIPNPNGGGFIDGFGPLAPRPNGTYICGQSGSSSNNCVLVGGDFHLVSFGQGDFDERKDAVTYQGLTFEAAEKSTILLFNAGDITFSDCIVRVCTKQEEFIVKKQCLL